MERNEYEAIINHLGNVVYPPNYGEGEMMELRERFRVDGGQLFYVEFGAYQSTPKFLAVVLKEKDVTERVFIECHLAAGYTFQRYECNIECDQKEILLAQL